jgi:hypothetical protein
VRFSIRSDRTRARLSPGRSPSTSAKLYEFFADDIKKLEQMIGRDLPAGSRNSRRRDLRHSPGGAWSCGRPNAYPRPMQLPSDLWLDQDDAHDRIDERQQAGRLSPRTPIASTRSGIAAYLQLSVDLDDELCLVRRRRRTSMARAARRSRGLTRRARRSGLVPRLPRANAARLPNPGLSQLFASRFGDLSPAEIFRMIELIFDQPALRAPSLYFESGSMQGLTATRCSS